MSGDTLFALQGICFAYDIGRPVLQNADFILSADERVALVGGNGAGKTTLLQIMVGLLKPQSGEIIAFGDRRRSEHDFRGVRGRAGLLFQDPDDQLFCPTVAEDVAFGPLNLGRNRAEAGRLVTRTLARLGLQGLENRVTYKLSGGEKRLVALATVLAMEPEVLLLDEPTAALDEGAQDRLLDILAGLPQAMVIVSHDRAFRERLATRHMTLAAGRLRPSPLA